MPDQFQFRSRNIYIGGFVLALFLWSGLTVAHATENSDYWDLTAEHVSGEILIKFSSDTSVATKQKLQAELLAEQVAEIASGGVVNWRLDLERLHELRPLREMRTPRNLESTSLNTASDSDILEQTLNSLSALPYIEYAEPNYIARALATPNDPYFRFQWNFSLIGMERTWAETQGAGATVAIIDTGVAYENFSRYALAPDLFGTEFVPGYNFVSRSTHANDDNGHGTHIAGTIAAVTNDNVGAAGIASRAKIMPIKVLDRSGQGTYADIAAAIRWAADHGADIINLSLGGPVSSQTLEAAVKYARSQNVLVIAASGNDGSGRLLYPAAYNNDVLSVGAVRYDKNKTSYSNYGWGLDLVAPGGDTAVDQNRDGYPDGILQQTLEQRWGSADTNDFAYYFYRGTSMAAPHVAATAALVKGLGIEQVDDIEKILFDAAEDLGSSGWDIYTGHGLVRADRAVQLALESGIKTQAANDGSEPVASPPAPIVNNESPNSETGETNPPAAEEPAQEPPEEEEPVPDVMKLVADTYNMFGRTDTIFTFWEKAFLGLTLTDSNNNRVSGANIEVNVLQGSSVVASGSGTSDKTGELWMELGNFARGSYSVLVKATKAGFAGVIKDLSFRFR